MATIFVGDIHGCIDEFNQLIELLPRHDRMILLGDMINRGPNSRAVLDRAREIGADMIVGNHEMGFLRYMQEAQFQPGHFEKVRSQFGDEVSEYLELIGSLPSYIQSDDWIAVHAGLAPGRAVEQTSPSILTRIRTWDGTGESLKNPQNPAWHEFYSGEKTVIYGHWAVQGYLESNNTICLDSGCVWGGQLTAMVWPSRELIQVPARKAYVEIPT